jgi:hypothetical protein
MALAWEASMLGRLEGRAVGVDLVFGVLVSAELPHPVRVRAVARSGTATARRIFMVSLLWLLECVLTER